MSENTDRPLPKQVAELLPHVPEEHRSWFLAGVRFASVGFPEYGDGLSRLSDADLELAILEEQADMHTYECEQKRREARRDITRSEIRQSDTRRLLKPVPDPGYFGKNSVTKDFS